MTDCNEAKGSGEHKRCSGEAIAGEGSTTVQLGRGSPSDTMADIGICSQRLFHTLEHSNTLCRVVQKAHEKRQADREREERIRLLAVDIGRLVDLLDVDEEGETQLVLARLAAAEHDEFLEACRRFADETGIAVAI